MLPVIARVDCQQALEQETSSPKGECGMFWVLMSGEDKPSGRVGDDRRQSVRWEVDGQATHRQDA